MPYREPSSHAEQLAAASRAASRLLAEAGCAPRVSSSSCPEDTLRTSSESISAPSESPASTPVSRRKLARPPAQKATHTGRNSGTPRLPPSDTPNPRGEGRVWRDRLATTKALLVVGTEAACRESLRTVSHFLQLLTTNDKSVTTHSHAKDLPEANIEIELRLCAQCVVLLLRTSTKEPNVWKRLSSSGTLMPTLEQCKVCSELPPLKQLLLASGITPVLGLLLNMHTRNPFESCSLLIPALLTTCHLCLSFNDAQAEQLPPLVGALVLFLSDACPDSVAVLAARALRQLAQTDPARPLVEKAGAIPCLLAACEEMGSRSAVSMEVVAAVGNLAVDEYHADLILRQGGVKKLLRLLREGQDQSADSADRGCWPAMLEAVCESLSALANFTGCKQAIVESGGVQVCTSRACRRQHQDTHPLTCSSCRFRQSRSFWSTSSLHLAKPSARLQDGC